MLKHALFCRALELFFLFKIANTFLSFLFLLVHNYFRFFVKVLQPELEIILAGFLRLPGGAGITVVTNEREGCLRKKICQYFT